MVETVARRKSQYKYNQKPSQIKKREARNKARYQMEKAGKVHKGDHKDVAHLDGHALHNVKSNWGVQSQHKNRSYPRTKGGHKKYPGS